MDQNKQNQYTQAFLTKESPTKIIKIKGRTSTTAKTTKSPSFFSGTAIDKTDFDSFDSNLSNISNPSFYKGASYSNETANQSARMSGWNILTKRLEPAREISPSAL